MTTLFRTLKSRGEQPRRPTKTCHGPAHSPLHSAQCQESCSRGGWHKEQKPTHDTRVPTLGCTRTPRHFKQPLSTQRPSQPHPHTSTIGPPSFNHTHSPCSPRRPEGQHWRPIFKHKRRLRGSRCSDRRRAYSRHHTQLVEHTRGRGGGGEAPQHIDAQANSPTQTHRSLG